MTEHTNKCGCPGCNWYEQDNQPPDPLEALQGWVMIRPAETITGTLRTNLIEDITNGCNEIIRLRNKVQQEPLINRGIRIDPLIMLHSWISCPPSQLMGTTEQHNLFEDIKLACTEIISLRRKAGEL